jgi:two-component system OmpR family sensor kinase
VGRLFWKLFLFIWLGQMMAVLGTGMLFWAERRGLVAQVEGGEHRPPPPHFDERRGPPPPIGESPGLLPPEHRPPPRPPQAPGLHLPFWPVVAGFFASLACAAGLAWYFAKPIRRLREGFASVANGDLAVRVSPGMGDRRDELADLGHDFDHMAERMQRVVEGQKRLLHDVSHELRSPLARLQAAVGLARQRPERTEDTWGRIERESERMNLLIGELLTLSRLDAGCSDPVGPVDMGELLFELVEDARFEGIGRQVAIDYVPGRMAQVMANGEMLHRAIENVVRNALRYAPPGSAVRIEAGASDSGSFRISVMDQGPGVDESELGAIFTPFYRGSAEKRGDGYGLGLAIAQQIVRAANGTITAKNGENTGLLVCVDMPLLCR